MDLEQAMKNRVNVGYGSQGQIGGSTVDFLKSQAFPLTDVAYEEYKTQQQGQTKPIQLYTEAEEAAGLPGMRKTASTLRGAIGNVEDALKRVEPDVSLRSQQSLVTE